MKAYEVIAKALSVDGMITRNEILNRYSNEEAAEKHKKAWETLWKEHSDAHKGVSPCWMDYEGTLVIKEITIDDTFISL